MTLRGRHLPFMRKTWTSLRFVATALLALALAASPAQAKKVNVKWKAMKKAVQYEIQIGQDGKTVATKIVKDPEWDGDLELGVYTYQIRAYDKIKRAGKWSSPHPLAVMPQPPQLSKPSDGQKIRMFAPTAASVFEWKPVAAANRYKIEIKRGEEIVKSEEVKETKFTVAGLKPGEYTWTVSAVVDASGRLPASLNGKSWSGEASKRFDFKVQHETLKTPELVFPIGAQMPPKDRKLEFRWKRVDGAEGYEIRVFPKAPAKRGIAGQAALNQATQALAPFKTLIVRNDTTTTVDMGDEGFYTWEARALAHLDEKNVAQAIGQKSIADFELNRNAAFTQHEGYVAMSFMLAPYNYRVESSTNPIRLNTDNKSTPSGTTRLSGEYWFQRQFGAAAGLDYNMAGINGIDNNRINIELVAKYRAMMSSSKYGWSFTPKAGFEYRQYNYIQPDQVTSTYNGSSYVMSTSFARAKFTSIGPSLGFDFRKRFNDHLSLGLKFAYFIPLTVSASPVQSDVNNISLSSLSIQRGGATNRNFGLGAQAVYWLTQRWSIGAGIFIENRSIELHALGNSASKTTGSGSPIDSKESIYTDAKYFFGSLIYSFGN